MTKTPERYLLACRLKRRARNAAAMVPCRLCGRPYMPHQQQLGCSNRCCEELRQRRATA